MLPVSEASVLPPLARKGKLRMHTHAASSVTFHVILSSQKFSFVFLVFEHPVGCVQTQSLDEANNWDLRLLTSSCKRMFSFLMSVLVVTSFLGTTNFQSIFIKAARCLPPRINRALCRKYCARLTSEPMIDSVQYIVTPSSSEILDTHPSMTSLLGCVCASCVSSQRKSL